MFNTHICKNCFQGYSGKPEVCPHCGAPINPKKQKPQNSETPEEDKTTQEQQTKEDKKPKKKKRHYSSKEIMASIKFEDLSNLTNDKDVKSWREKKKVAEKTPQFNVESDGEYSVDVSDVTYLPQTYNYSVKKARGEYEKPKIKWWEIYKWADLLLARRKVKKQVKKASYYKPEQFSKTKLIILCLLFGYIGAHNFYARNYKKATFSLFCTIVGCTVLFVDNPVFRAVRLSIGGGLMFITIFLWWLDFINLCFNRFSYRLSKWCFIDNLNTQTRAILGSKYIDKDLYKKPWIARVIISIKNKIETSKAKKAKKVEEKEQLSAQEK